MSWFSWYFKLLVLFLSSGSPSLRWEIASSLIPANLDISLKAVINNPPQKIRPEGLQHCEAMLAPSGPESLRDGFFGGGFERKLPKKIHNGSENSESQKKWKNFTAQNNLQAILLLMGIEIFWFRHNLWPWRPFKEGKPHLVYDFATTFFKPP